jgi:DNA-directed RNA polymerase subunit RPC12/RpoP
VSSSTSTGFDRLRPRHVEADQSLPISPDNEGKRALFSTSTPRPARGSVTVDCSSCGERSVLSPTQATRLLLTTVHAPGLRRHHVSWVRCPACGHRSWSRLRLCV